MTYAIHLLACLGFFLMGMRHERARLRRPVPMARIR